MFGNTHIYIYSYIGEIHKAVFSREWNNSKIKTETRQARNIILMGSIVCMQTLLHIFPYTFANIVPPGANNRFIQFFKMQSELK